MTAPCERCDRVECRAGKVPMSREVREAFDRLLSAGDCDAVDRALITHHGNRTAAADRACEANRHDFRAEARALRAKLAKIEQLIEAVRASGDSYQRWVAVNALLAATKPEPPTTSPATEAGSVGR